MVSKYPNAIDGYSDIRVVRDGIEEVLARDHNDNRSAIVAIEQTLGLNPQGAYGTVVARLDQADTDFSEHISGTGHRHVADHIDYPGSSPSAFADGYMLIPAKLGRTISEMVARIGASTPAGASGADKVGITPYTDPYYKYSHPSTQVRGQILGIQNDLAENATLLERTLGSFVVDGMAVTDPYGTGNTARVASGHIVSDGRLLRFDGADLAVPSAGSPTTYYVYAVITGGSVSVGIDNTTLPSMDPLNPTVLLRKIVRSSGTWDSGLSTDIRRYGMLANNKNFFSVGQTPVGGKDGYGCDFLSLKAAVDYVRALTISGKLIAPLRIELVTDLIIANDADFEMLVDTDGLVIDGCGKRITATTGISHVLFSIQADNVKIENLTLVSNCATPLLTFANLGTSNSVSNIHIDNCGIDVYPGQAPGNKFLLFGEATGVFTVFNTFITDNVATVANGGIVCAATSQYAQVLQNSKITGNIIRQQTLALASYPGIQASVNCVVSDNLVFGGYVSGICLNAPVNTIVSKNIILGTDYASVAMPTGIALWAPGPSGNGYGALVTHNIVRGVNNFGIDNKAGARAGNQTVIVNNTVDNSNISTWPYGAFGIRVYRYEVPVVDNKIVWMGYPIYQANYVVGNDIYGHGVAAGDGILCVPSSTKAVVCNNRIYNLLVDYGLYSVGSAININGADQAVVSGNEIQNCSANGGPYLNAGITMGRAVEATVFGNLISYPTAMTNKMLGISDIGDDSVVCGNTIVRMQTDAIMASSAGALRLVVVGNKAYNCGRHGISVSDTVGSIVSNNLLVVDDVAVTSPGVGIMGFSSHCIVSGNYVYGYAAGGYYGISGAGGDSTILSGNLITDLHTNTSGAIDMSSGWSNISVVGNLVLNTKWVGISLGSATYSLIANNHLSAGTAAATVGINGVGSTCLIANNQILGYGTGISHAGIRLASSQSGVQIIGNQIVGQGGDCIDLAAATLCSVVGNVLQGNAYSNSAINNYGGVSTLTNNQILYCGASTSSNIINAAGSASTDPLITGNQLILCRGTGIYCYGADRCMIVGNDLIGVDGSATSGIQSFGSSSLILGNIVRQYGFTGYPIGTFPTAHDFIVANNIISDMNGIAGAGIAISSSCQYAIIMGNVVGDPSVGAPTPFDGIDMNGSTAGLVYGNIVYGAASSGSSYGIRDLGAYSMAGGNYLILTNGGGISIYGSTSEVLVFSNFIEQVGAHGIYAPSCSALSIIGNRIHTSTPHVWNAIDVIGYYVLISNNTIYNHYAGILLRTGSGYSMVNGNSVVGADYGIQIGLSLHDFGHTGVVGNLVGFCIQGIIVLSDGVQVVGNLVSRYSVFGIDVSYLDSQCVVGNFIIDPDGASALGLDLTNCTTSLAGSNWAEGGASSYGIVITGTNTVMTGNLSHGGSNPAAWGAGGYIDVDNRYYP